MRTEEYRHVLTIQNKSIVKDVEGVAVEAWVDYLPIRASYNPASGKEVFQEGATSALTTAIFKTRYRTDIDTTMRIVSVFGIYNINAVIDTEGKHRELQLICTSEVHNG